MGLLDSLGHAAGAMAAGAVNGWQANLHKAVAPDEGSARAPGGNAEDTADNAPVPTEKAKDSPKTLFFDPWSVLEQMGYKERAAPIGYGTINSIVQRMPVVGAVIKTRVDQVAMFGKPQVDRYSYGFRVRLRDRNEKPSRASKKHCEAQTSFMLRTGITDHPQGRHSFSDFLKKFTRDSLRYDQATFEVVPNRLGQPAEFYACDAAAMRLADSDRLELDEDYDDDIRYVQLYDGVVINQYTQGEMCFGVRNPCTDMRLFGYGVSECEMAMNAIAGLLNGWQYNERFFSQGSGAKGVLNFKGPIPDSMLEKFKMQFYSMLTGVQNAWRTPIINADDVQWIPLQGMSNSDMEFSQWIDFLIKVFCAFYSMNPAEVNFQYGNAGQTNTLQGESNRDKIIESRERGLLPILEFIAECLNRHIIWPINESFEFEFVGLQTETKGEVADLNSKRVKTYMTIDELRAEDDKPPLPNGEGSIILDPTFLQARVASQQSQQSSEQSPADEDTGDHGLTTDSLKQLLGGNDGGVPNEDQDPPVGKKPFGGPSKIKQDDDDTAQVGVGKSFSKARSFYIDMEI